jgi:hypothetical protein
LELDYPHLGKFARAAHEFAVYITSNADSLINYGERYRAGERISSCLAESTVNAVISKRFAKRQQMQWTKRGAHLLLQTRTRALMARSGHCSRDGIQASPTTTPLVLLKPPHDTPGILMLSYQRVPRLFALLALGRGDGRYAKLMRQLGRVDLLILDDWGPEPLLPEQQRDLLEIVEDRYNAGSLIITSQLPVDRWYELVGNPTLADAILDRIVHNAYRVELSGESLRKPTASA